MEQFRLKFLIRSSRFYNIYLSIADNEYIIQMKLIRSPICELITPFRIQQVYIKDPS